MEAQLETWHRFFNASLTKRLPPETFQRLVKACLLKTEAAPGRSLASALLAESRKMGLQQADPRVPLYINELLKLELCSAADVLFSLLPAPPLPPPPLQPPSSSSLGVGGGGGGGGGGGEQAADVGMTMMLPEMEGVMKPSVEAMVLEALTVMIEEGLLKTNGDVADLLRGSVFWMERFPGSMALGYLVYATFRSALAEGVMGLPSMKETKSSFSRCLSVLISHLSRTNIQLATALDYLQKQYDLRDEVVTGQNLELLDGVDLSAMAFQQSVMDTPTIHTRAGLYIYLNAMLNGRPLFDDLQVIDYLNAKYKDDVQALVTDLILASFDILASAMYRSETTESTINLLRSFLVNKLPVFLTNYAAMMFEGLTVRNCIQQALTRVDPAAFPPSYSQMFDPLGTTGMLSEARQEFLFACALHQLIEEKDIEGLLGDVPMQSLPASGRYIKNGLVAQCSSNPAKIEEFIGELDNMEGNAGEIVAALLAIINTLCTNNDTMTLKIVCSALCRKPQALDVIMLFTESATFMSPLCHVLDNWANHEDQGEQQPVYAEFGSILLLIIFAKHRFNMQAYDLGIQGPDSFVLRYIKNASMARSPDDLTEHEDVLLRGWIRGLFEAEGINDDLMSMCSPNEFHLLVATLFDQSLKACHAELLAPETLESGFGYLFEPFLLPSLAAGLDWFAQHIWSLSDATPPFTPSTFLLKTLMNPRSLSPESSALYSLVLSIVGKPLEDALGYAQRQHPLRADIPAILETLKQHLSCDPLKHHVQRQRHEAAFLVDLESWSVAPGGGLVAALKTTIRALVAWSTNTTSYVTIPPYNHRQLLETLRILGAKQVLSHLLDEILSHHPSSTANSLPGPSPTPLEICTDIITTLICAPSSHSFSPSKTPTNLSPNTPPALTITTTSTKHQLTLRDALSYEFDHSYDLSKEDLRRAEIIVRLHRQVEVLLGRNSVVVGGETVEDGNGGMVTVTRGVDAGGMDMTMGDNIDDVLVQAEDRFLSGDVGFLGGILHRRVD